MQRRALKGESNEPVADGGIESRTSPSEQPEPAAREDLVDLCRRRTSGATVRCQMGVFPSGFPRHVADLGPIHNFAVIPTAGGAASAAAAQPRIGATRGGVAVRDFRVFDRGQYEYEYERLRIKCAKTATLGYWTPSCYASSFFSTRNQPPSYKPHERAPSH